MMTHAGVEVQLHSLLTSALDGGEWSDSLPRGRSPQYPVETGWASEPVWTLWGRKKFLAPAGNRTLAMQPVAGRYAG
jgi:hypothetical protein